MDIQRSFNVRMLFLEDSTDAASTRFTTIRWHLRDRRPDLWWGTTLREAYAFLVAHRPQVVILREAALGGHAGDLGRRIERSTDEPRILRFKTVPPERACASARVHAADYDEVLGIAAQALFYGARARLAPLRAVAAIGALAGGEDRFPSGVVLRLMGLRNEAIARVQRSTPSSVKGHLRRRRDKLAELGVSMADLQARLMFEAVCPAGAESPSPTPSSEPRRTSAAALLSAPLSPASGNGAAQVLPPPSARLYQEHKRCGRCDACQAGGRGHGPYLVAMWREGDLVRRISLGRVGSPNTRGRLLLALRSETRRATSPAAPDPARTRVPSRGSRPV